MNIISRSEAKAIGLRHYFTGVPCTNGHVANRQVSNHVCVGCARIHTNVWATSNTEKAKASKAAWVAANPEKVLYCPIKGRESVRRYQAANPAKIQECKRRYYIANPDKSRADRARRRARKLELTPSDADHAAINTIYKNAARLTRITGVSYHVDHIKPLSKGGPHHQDNLVVMRGDWNLRKSTTHWPWLRWFNEAP